MLNDDRCSDKKYYWKYTFYDWVSFLYPFIFSTLYREKRSSWDREREREKKENTNLLFLCVNRIAIHIIDTNKQKKTHKQKQNQGQSIIYLNEQTKAKRFFFSLHLL